MNTTASSAPDEAAFLVWFLGGFVRASIRFAAVPPPFPATWVAASIRRSLISAETADVKI